MPRKEIILIFLSMSLVACNTPIQDNTIFSDRSFSIKSTNGFVESSDALISFDGNWNSASNASHSGGSIKESFPIDDTDPSLTFHGIWSDFSDSNFTGNSTKTTDNTLSAELDFHSTTSPNLKYSSNNWVSGVHREYMHYNQQTITKGINDASIIYNGPGWATDTTSKTQDFQFNDSSTTNNITFTFTGNSIEIGVLRSPEMGKVKITVFDGATQVNQSVADLYIPSGSGFNFIPVKMTGTPKLYTVVIEPDSTNHPSQKYSFLKLVVHPSSVNTIHHFDSNVIYKKNSNSYNINDVKNGTVQSFGYDTINSEPYVTNTNGLDSSSIEIPFYGTNIHLAFVRYKNRGMVNIKVYDANNNLERDLSNIDLYSSGVNVMYYKINALKMGNHKVVITPSGTKNASSIGYYYTFAKALVYESFEYTFNGTDVNYRSMRSPERGIVDVTIDNNPSNTQAVDLYMSPKGNSNYSVNNLSKGNHTITVEATPNKNTNATGYKISLFKFTGKAKIEGTFNGTEVKFLAVKKSDSGKANLYIDNVYKQDLDFYVSSALPKVLPITISGLSDAAHTFSIVATNEKNTSSSGYNMALDSIINSKASYTFNSDKISLFSYKGPDQGIAEVYIDGVFNKFVDLYSATPLYNQNVFSLNDLPFAEHTIEVKASGQKNAASDGYKINIDALDSRTFSIPGGVGGD